jgi:hypothetical protein
METHEIFYALGYIALAVGLILLVARKRGWTLRRTLRGLGHWADRHMLALLLLFGSWFALLGFADGQDGSSFGWDVLGATILWVWLWIIPIIVWAALKVDSGGIPRLPGEPGYIPREVVVVQTPQPVQAPQLTGKFCVDKGWLRFQRPDSLWTWERPLIDEDQYWRRIRELDALGMDGERAENQRLHNELAARMRWS